jgi:hypothetical protein
MSLVFCHYPQIIGTNCISEPFQTSTLLSKRFILSRDRSIAFGSSNLWLHALIGRRALPKLRAGCFRYATAKCLGSPQVWTPRSVFRDGTDDPGPLSSYYHLAMISLAETLPFRAIHVCYHVVSGTFHSRISNTFQLSLTLLVRYRSRGVFRLRS